jgi:hypothetical protein
MLTVGLLAGACLMLAHAAAGTPVSSPHACAPDALRQAERLLAFHVGGDDRLEVTPPVVLRSPLPNPANPDQMLDVLEVWGSVYKASYRMRFLYARLPGACVLMGQEILEHADLQPAADRPKPGRAVERPKPGRAG